MEARPLRERLQFELDQVRTELDAEVRRFAADEVDWVPRPGMKSCRALLQEIGTMETLCVRCLTGGTALDWQATWDSLAWTGADPEPALQTLAQVRAETLAFLSAGTDEKLQNPVPLPKGWEGYFGSPAVEPVEMLRWIARHEYYHLGQLVIYRWMLSDNPYQRS